MLEIQSLQTYPSKKSPEGGFLKGEKRGGEPLPEILDKEIPIFAVCFNGRSRSKIIAQALDNLGWKNTRVLGINGLHDLDDDLLKELQKASVVVCANSDILSELRKYDGGSLIGVSLFLIFR